MLFFTSFTVLHSAFLAPSQHPKCFTTASHSPIVLWMCVRTYLYSKGQLLPCRALPGSLGAILGWSVFHKDTAADKEGVDFERLTLQFLDNLFNLQLSYTKHICCFIFPLYRYRSQKIELLLKKILRWWLVFELQKNESQLNGIHKIGRDYCCF